MARDYRQMQLAGAAARKKNNQPNRVDDLAQRLAEEAPDFTDEQVQQILAVLRRAVGGECE